MAVDIFIEEEKFEESYNKEKMKTCAQNAGRRELLPGAKRPRKSNGAAIFNIDSFHYKKQTIKKEEI